MVDVLVRRSKGMRNEVVGEGRAGLDMGRLLSVRTGYHPLEVLM